MIFQLIICLFKKKEVYDICDAKSKDFLVNLTHPNDWKPTKTVILYKTYLI